VGDELYKTTATAAYCSLALLTFVLRTYVDRRAAQLVATTTTERCDGCVRDNGDMGVIGGGRTEAIMREIASLRAQRDELDSRIRFFESQLRVGGAAPAATLPPSLSTKLDAMGWHAAAAQGGGGLSPDMVRRYSRHLLLPDFGVQG